MNCKMITIKVDYDSQGLITGYKVEGHAELAEAGKDILCAAVSTLTQTPILGLERHLQYKPRYKVGDAKLQVQLDRADDTTQAILMTMVHGLRDLAEKYPKRVRIENER